MSAVHDRKGTPMSKRPSVPALLVSLLVAVPALMRGDGAVLLAQLSSTDQLPAVADRYSYTYFDPFVISPACADAADPLGCTADADAVTLADDAAGDAVSLESSIEESSTFDSADADTSSIDLFSPDPVLSDPTAVDPWTYDSP